MTALIASFLEKVEPVVAQVIPDPVLARTVALETAVVAADVVRQVVLPVLVQHDWHGNVHQAMAFLHGYLTTRITAVSAPVDTPVLETAPP